MRNEITLSMLVIEKKEINKYYKKIKQVFNRFYSIMISFFAMFYCTEICTHVYSLLLTDRKRHHLLNDTSIGSFLFPLVLYVIESFIHSFLVILKSMCGICFCLHTEVIFPPPPVKSNMIFCNI